MQLEFSIERVLEQAGLLFIKVSKYQKSGVTSGQPTGHQEAKKPYLLTKVFFIPKSQTTFLTKLNFQQTSSN
jgi:hypothetical protein